MRKCAQCGGDPDITDSSGNVVSGAFTETYECPNCGATGEITGNAENPPGEWHHLGELFAEDEDT